MLKFGEIVTCKVGGCVRLKCLIWPVLLYGCEAWTLKKADITRLEAAEMWLYRRLLRISWTEKRTNASILEQLGTTRKITPEINKRRLAYIGHATRNKKTDLMISVLQGKTETKRKQGRPPITYHENIKKASQLEISEMTRKAQDRNKWRRFCRDVQHVAANIDDDEADR